MTSLLVLAASPGWFESLERDIIHTVTCLWSTPFWHRTFLAMQKTELAIPLILMVLLFIALRSPQRGFRALVTILLSFGVGMIVAGTLWATVDRKRPPWKYERWLRTPEEKALCADHPEWLALHKGPSRRPSVPSRHGLTIGFAMTAIFLASRRIGWLALVYGIIAAVGRDYVGKHWPSDVLAGVVIGALVAWAIWRLLPRVFERFGRASWVLEPEEIGIRASST